ncbi:phosphodiesterase [Ancylobacter amanitiformis]|uniref:3',5'-cyclic AMP phosphodiesterase CpdA n=1 Tax=Ancylobacter amanitiformis TaxID=217069 RepID=A0ABU0LME9_9HYPH|nr:phosphodiesterase [Ancylobacter amanitiformis]MDQ0509870.1 3',5'-cyclic AMP phosphodiesterase CpdA [Ancylobacter amanitiformis]
MKIIQVSDLHLVTPGEPLFGSDPLDRLEDCIVDLNLHHADADLVVFSGDLTNDGEPAAYAALGERLEALVPPFRLMLGNHDARAAFGAVFSEALDPDGFAHSFVDIDGMRIVLLDTLEPGRIEGRLCGARLDWLDARLADADHVLMFLHHPPCPIGVPALDDTCLAEAGRLMEVLRRHHNVRHIFAGHVHRLANGSWGGIPFSTLRGTNHQSALTFTGPYAVSFESPAYAVILASGGSVTVHPHEFPVRDWG